MKKYIIINILFLSCLTQGYSQTSIGGEPYGWQNETLQSKSSIPSITLPNLDMNSIKKEDQQSDGIEGSFRFGISQNVNINLNNSGIWQETSDGGRLWKFKIYSPDAKSINLTYDKFWLPEGAKLFIYSENEENTLGAFTALNNKGTKAEPKGFATTFTIGNTAIIEYYEPKGISGGIISIDKIISGYRDIQQEIQPLISSYSSQTQDNQSAVAILYYENKLLGLGVLTNNTKGDNKMYIITLGAKNVSDYNKLIFLWPYDGHYINPTHTTTGANLLNKQVISEPDNIGVSFCELLESPISSSNFTPYFMGWNSSGESLNGSYFKASEGLYPDIIEVAENFKLIHYGGGYHQEYEISSLPNYYWYNDEIKSGGTNNNGQVYADKLLGPIFDNNSYMMGMYARGAVIPNAVGNFGYSNRMSSIPLIQNQPLFFRFDLIFNESSGIVKSKLDPLNVISSMSNRLNGTYINTNISIVNQTITTSKQFSGLDIDISNTTVSNNATVLFNAQNRVKITPQTVFNTGTTIRITANSSGSMNINTRSASMASEVADVTASIKEANLNNKVLSLSPNPTNGIVYFNCSDYEAEGIIKIYTTAGALVYTNSGIKNGDQIDLSSLVKGLYLARIEINGEIFTKKIILK